VQNAERRKEERRIQNGESRVQYRDHAKRDLAARLLQFAVRIVRISAALPKTEEGLHVRRQILRSGTSAGANYQGARGAGSRADFLHKMQIVLKELRETHFWLSLIEAAEFLPKSRLSDILKESNELIAFS
jgi:four helix bundle protein